MWQTNFVILLRQCIFYLLVYLTEQINIDTQENRNATEVLCTAKADLQNIAEHDLLGLPLYLSERRPVVLIKSLFNRKFITPPYASLYKLDKH